MNLIKLLEFLFGNHGHCFHLTCFQCRVQKPASLVVQYRGALVHMADEDTRMINLGFGAIYAAKSTTTLPGKDFLISARQY